MEPVLWTVSALLVWSFCDAMGVDNIGVRIVGMQAAVGWWVWQLRLRKPLRHYRECRQRKAWREQSARREPPGPHF